MKPFFDAIEDTKKVLKARKAEEEGTAFHVVTPSVAALHRRIVEDAIDKREHVYSGIRAKRKTPEKGEMFQLCPIKIQHGSVLVRFVWSSDNSLNDGTLYTYLESILCNASPPLSDRERHSFIRRVIESDVAAQMSQFSKVNEKIEEILSQFESIAAGIKFAQQHAPHTVHTRKSNVSQGAPAGSDPTSPVIAIQVTPSLTVDWNVLTPDAITEDFAKQLENEQDQVASSDILFTLLDFSHRHRIALFHIQPQVIKKNISGRLPDQTESHANFSDSEVVEMNEVMDAFVNEALSESLRTIASSTTTSKSK
jgi:hypothetical protein